MHMNEELRKDIIEWDTVNWGTFIDFIDSLGLDFRQKDILDIGARDGGLSLYFALKGGNICCSDLNGPSERARELHKRYEVETRVRYEVIDATNIPLILYCSSM